MSDLPMYILKSLEKQPPETLREIAQIATEMADEKERQLEAELGEQEIDDEPDNLARDNAPSRATLTAKKISGNQYYYWQWREGLARDNAPSRATLTAKKISGNQYYYWQWREGKKIKSEYIRPVDPER
ncbi:hypothetical protein C492_07845 [Natronococcus jeotgali DSM 18795]|uniref:DUF6788 domain-containing protein n=1 Tax=Natronococcus jeotgali DSM 18795 TaxID=1227498 RepID=L9XLH5_9EURY|nr:hypothetical protein C492_07845 [Natronococcus jeotgali DSM 18795]